jgi:HPt (histidine-containing phosphotransfer) domain-containing protein
MALQKVQDCGELRIFEVFDQAHLAHYTMNSVELEREIIDLFLQQLPVTIALIEDATTAAEWKLATHTLKGAAAAVGAHRLKAIAVDLEKLNIDADVKTKEAIMAALFDANEEFKAAVRQIYS